MDWPSSLLKINIREDSLFKCRGSHFTGVQFFWGENLCVKPFFGRFDATQRAEHTWPMIKWMLCRFLIVRHSDAIIGYLCSH